MMGEREESIVTINGTDRSLILWTPAHSNYSYRLSQDTWLILDEEWQMREVDAPVNSEDERIAHWDIALADNRHERRLKRCVTVHYVLAWNPMSRDGRCAYKIRLRV